MTIGIGLSLTGPRRPGVVTPTIFPAISDENAVFNNEGVITGWTLSGGTSSVSSGVLRVTKTAASGTRAFITQPVSVPAAQQDFIVYGRVRVQNTGASILRLTNAGVSKVLGIWFNATELGVPAAGQISLVGYDGATATSTIIATGVDTSTNFIDFALQYDKKWSSVTCFFREVDGTWAYKGRIAYTDIVPINIEFTSGSTAAIGYWFEYDYITVAKPNIVVISDSIGEGKTLYSPNRSLALANYESTWQAHAAIYPTLRNNLIVNKAVGAETSTATLARIADATVVGPRVVFLHASTNDSAAGVSAATRTTNTQSMINAVSAAGASTVLLNAVYGTSANALNPGLRDYMTSWWATNRLTLTGVSKAIDIMQPIIDGSGYMQTALTQADNIHPTIAGHTAIGDFIEAA